MDEKTIVKKMTALSIIGNAVLSGFKLIAGLLGRSSAMVSDAIHSMSDVFTTVIAWLGTKIANKTADEDHPYGHERFECMASLILAIILAVTGFGIGYSGIKVILSGDYSSIQIPTMLPVIAAIFSILSKEGMYRYTLYYAKMIRSTAFEADAWHHRSDALSSIGSLIGIVFAKIGFPVMDAVASIVICLFIFKVSFDILKESIDRMLDKSCGPEYENALTELILSCEGVEGIDLLKTRQFGSKVYVDVEIAVNKDLSLVEAHDIAEKVHDQVEHNNRDIKHVMIHVNPGE